MSVDTNGLLKIKFSNKMNTNLNISWINKSNTVIYIQPQDKREYDDGFIWSSLNLTWNVTSFQDDTIKIDLIFVSPLYISPNITQDKIFVFFN